MKLIYRPFPRADFSNCLAHAGFRIGVAELDFWPDE